MLPVERIRHLVDYDFERGIISNKNTKRALTIDEQGLVTIYDVSVNKRYRIKAEKVCWGFIHGSYPPDTKKILFRNMNERDFRIRNLMTVDRKEYNKIKEAYRNLTGELKLIPHPEDQYSYILCYQVDYVDKREVIHDIVIARKKYVSLQLKFAKVLTSYCIFD